MSGKVISVGRFIAIVLQQVAQATRDQPTLDTLGLTASEAILEVDKMIWEGLLAPE